MPGPVVDLNRAVALGMAFGPAAGLELIDAIAEDPALAGYHLLPAVRGDLLAKLGCFEAGRIELERAAKLTQNERERAMLLARARANPERRGRVPFAKYRATPGRVKQRELIGVDVAPGVHDGPISVFTMRRSGRSRWSYFRRK